MWTVVSDWQIETSGQCIWESPSLSLPFRSICGGGAGHWAFLPAVWAILDFLNFTLSLSLHLLSLPHFMFLFWILPSSLSLKFQVTEKVAGIQKAS